MTNEELIEQLKKFPPKDAVWVGIPYEYNTRYDRAYEVIGVSHDDAESGVTFIDVK